MQTLEEKLKRYVSKTKRRELVLPKEMLREAVSRSKLSDVIESCANLSSGYYDNIENVKKYSVRVPKVISLYEGFGSDYEDDEQIVHQIEFYNKEKFYLPFDYGEFYKNNFMISMWKNVIFPKMEIGNLYYTVSPITYLISDFNDLLAYGAHRVEWDLEIKEGTIIIVYNKVDIDGNMFTKILYDGKFYWCFGVLADEETLRTFNPHFI